MAGIVHWGVPGWLGSFLNVPTWCMTAFIGSGAIFPMALVFAAIFRNPFMKDKTATGDVLLPLAVAGVYLLTVIALVIASAVMKSPE